MFFRRRIAGWALVLLAGAWPLGLLGQAESPGATPAPAAPPALPSSPGAVRSPQPAVPPHRFWDRTNILLFSGVAVFRGLDYASTRNFQARGRTEILLASDVVNNSAAFAGVEAAGAATSVGLSYWLHRKGHHSMERWLSIGHIAVTGFGVAWNYSLESKRPR
jgi:hypothetical protein